MKCSFLVLLILVFAGCSTVQKSYPPAVEVYIGDGAGGADRMGLDGVPVYLPPSKLKNAWCSYQDQMAAFMAWCYNASPQETLDRMQIK
jgi:hypothetical protein